MLPEKIPFVEARYKTVLASRKPQLIVIHTMEAPEKGQTAENIANYFANMPDGRKASAHYCIDNNSIVQCVQCKDVAYAAPNANRYGIHLEHSGYARQTVFEWGDAYSMDMLRLSAELCAKVLCVKFDIDIRWLSLQDIIEHRINPKITGFCTHADVTHAFNTPGGHTDPGKHFPKAQYLAMIKGFKAQK